MNLPNIFSKQIYPVMTRIQYSNGIVRTATLKVTSTRPWQDFLGTAWIIDTREQFLDELEIDTRDLNRSTKITVAPSFPVHPNCALNINGEQWKKIARG